MCSTRGQLDRRGASIKEGARYWVARTSMNISLEKKSSHLIVRSRFTEIAEEASTQLASKRD